MVLAARRRPELLSRKRQQRPGSSCAGPGGRAPLRITSPGTAMNDPRHQLTPRIQELICAYLRAGSFPHVAAEAAGVPQKVFERWLRWGRAKRPVPLYRDFYEAVSRAQAEARL